MDSVKSERGPSTLEEFYDNFIELDVFDTCPRCPLLDCHRAAFAYAVSYLPCCHITDTDTHLQRWNARIRHCGCNEFPAHMWEDFKNCLREYGRELESESWNEWKELYVFRGSQWDKAISEQRLKLLDCVT